MTIADRIRLCVVLMDRKIIALRKQRRNPNRINVCLDGDFVFGVARIVGAWLQVGQILDEAKIAHLQQQDTLETAYQSALRYISYKPRSEHEVRQKLITRGCAADVIQCVIDKLLQHKLVEDHQFARFWVENRSAFRPRSYRMMAYELRQKGVAQCAIENALKEAAAEDELAYQAVTRKLGRFASNDWNAFRQKVLAYLGRRGFSYETSAPVIRRIWADLKASNGVDTQFSNEEDYDE